MTVAAPEARRIRSDEEALEVARLGRTGLLALGVPAERGGAAAKVETIVEVFRLISAADPAIGQIPQNHFQLVDAIVRYGDVVQKELLLGDVVRGAVTAQWVPVIAKLEGERGRERIAFVYLPRDAEGLEVVQDWTAFGQRATVSGTTVLEEVEVRPEWVLFVPEREEADTFASFAQVLHAAVDVGIARGALDEAARHLRDAPGRSSKPSSSGPPTSPTRWRPSGGCRSRCGPPKRCWRARRSTRSAARPPTSATVSTATGGTPAPTPCTTRPAGSTSTSAAGSSTASSPAPTTT